MFDYRIKTKMMAWLWRISAWRAWLDMCVGELVIFFKVIFWNVCIFLKFAIFDIAPHFEVHIDFIGYLTMSLQLMFRLVNLLLMRSVLSAPCPEFGRSLSALIWCAQCEFFDRERRKNFDITGSYSRTLSFFNGESCTNRFGFGRL